MGRAREAPAATGQPDVRDAGLFEAVGGAEGCRRLSVAFYARVPRDPVLHPLFPSTFRCPIEGLSLFLAQFLGGPLDYSSQRRWWLSLRASHHRFGIGQAERDAWVGCMRQALDDVHVDGPARDALIWFFERSASFMVNRGGAQQIEEDPGGRPRARMVQEIAQRWDTMRAVEDLVAAVRDGDAPHVRELAGSPTLRRYFDHDRAAYVSLLVLMIGSGDEALLDYARQQVVGDPQVAHDRYVYGRTLLHGAAAAGNLGMVEVLLDRGADPDATDSWGHTPLYCAANESAAGGGPVVRALVHAGANVNGRDRLQQCSALHMAARRGNVEVAEALLDCGADIEIRDRKGDTPLRRAVNTGKAAVAALLLARGADKDAQGSRGLTPVQAARTPAIKQLLRPDGR